MSKPHKVPDFSDVPDAWQVLEYQLGQTIGHDGRPPYVALDALREIKEQLEAAEESNERWKAWYSEKVEALRAIAGGYWIADASTYDYDVAQFARNALSKRSNPASRAN